MKTSNMQPFVMIVIALVLASSVMLGQAAEQPPPVPAEEQPEVLTRGPVNEAFAQPVDLEAQKGLVAPKAPPANINEEPPATRPAGEQFAWVPGYWAWDSDRQDYIWVSGCWRAVPPGMAWVPGYWYQTDGGWQWVAGFWAPAGEEDIEYLPAPPALTDAPAPGPPPSPDQIWVPPCWYWSHGQYVWRPGYWLTAQTNWIWVPSHYVWTPHGYVFAGGYWDFVLDHRGVLFAPVYFPPRVYRHPGYFYRLNIVLAMDNLTFGLFARPHYGHYYFGDYYDRHYVRAGIFPWYECQHRHGWYDPVFVHSRWRHFRDDPRWDEHERREYERRRDNPSLRPPRTYQAMERVVKTRSPARDHGIEFAGPMDRIAARQPKIMPLEKIHPDVQRRMATRSAEVRRFGEERRKWERPAAGTGFGPPSVEYAPTPHSRRAEPLPPRPSKSAEPARQSRANDRLHGDEPYRYDKIRVPVPPVADRQRSGVNRGHSPSWPPQEKNKF